MDAIEDLKKACKKLNLPTTGCIKERLGKNLYVWKGSTKVDLIYLTTMEKIFESQNIYKRYENLKQALVNTKDNEKYLIDNDDIAFSKTIIFINEKEKIKIYINHHTESHIRADNHDSKKMKMSIIKSYIMTVRILGEENKQSLGINNYLYKVI